MLNYPQGEFLQDRCEKRVGARFHPDWTCMQKDKFDQRQGRTQSRGEIHPGVKLYV